MDEMHTYIIETLRTKHRVSVPQEYRTRVSKGDQNGNSFCLSMEDGDGVEVARWQQVTMFYRDGVIVLPESTTATVRKPPSALDGGGSGTGKHPFNEKGHA